MDKYIFNATIDTINNVKCYKLIAKDYRTFDKFSITIPERKFPNEVAENIHAFNDIMKSALDLDDQANHIDGSYVLLSATRLYEEPDKLQLIFRPRITFDRTKFFKFHLKETSKDEIDKLKLDLIDQQEMIKSLRERIVLLENNISKLSKTT